MIKNKMPFLVGLIVFFLVFTIALALENVLEKSTILNAKDSDVIRVLNNKIKFFNDGYVNYLDYTEEHYFPEAESMNDKYRHEYHNKLVYYDKSNKFVKEANVPNFAVDIYTNGFDDWIITDDFIYVFGKENYESEEVITKYVNKRHIVYIYKYNKNLEVEAKLEISNFDTYFDSLYSVDSDGYVYLCIRYRNEDVSAIIKIDKDLSHYEEIGATKDNIEKYFPPLILEKKLNLPDKVEFELTDEYYDMKDLDNYVISSSKKIGSGDDVKYKGYLKYVIDDVVSFEIEDENYISFSNPRIFNNLVFVFGNYASNSMGYKSDILVYDLSGNLLQVVENNSVNRSFDIKDDKLLLSRNYFDGELIGDSYNFFKRHQIYFYNDMYKINDEFLVSSITNKPIKPIENPETKDFAIILIIVISVVSLIYFFLINKKKNFINK